MHRLVDVVGHVFVIIAQLIVATTRLTCAEYTTGGYHSMNARKYEHVMHAATQVIAHTTQLFFLHCIVTIDPIRILQTDEFMFGCRPTPRLLLPYTFAGYFNPGSPIHSYSDRTTSNYRKIFAHIYL